MGNAVGLGVSAAFVTGVLALSGLLSRRGASAEATRKLVHIALGLWWLIAWAFFTSAVWAAVLPAAFVAVNAFAWRRQKMAFMERTGAEETPGTVYYAASLTLLALFSFGIGLPFVGALGVFCMAFGDGFAAVAGKRFGKRPLALAGSEKTLMGSAVMFLASFVSCAAVLAFAAHGAGAAGAGAGDGVAGAMGAADVAGAVGAWGSAGAVGVAWVAAAAALLAAVATALEAASPAGLDNLSVPLGVSALYAVLFLPASWCTPALVGLLLSGAVVLASFRLRLLTVPGGLGAVVVGTLAFAFGGWPLWLLLMWFFGSANIAARFMARRAARRSGEAKGASVASQALKPKREEGEPRKLRQVLANSLPFLACAAAFAATGDPWLLVVSAGALAACTADTWASEVGVYSKDDPVNILTRQPMQRGLSGGVSPLGLLATVVGSAATAALALLLFRAFASPAPTEPTAFFLIMACGVVGSLVDSVLGARLQAKYRCPGIPLLVEAVPAGEAAVAGPGAFPPPVGVVSEVAAAGEAAPAGEGRPAQGVQDDEDVRRPACGFSLVSGYAWVTNDAVNLMSGLAAAALGLLLAL